MTGITQCMTTSFKVDCLTAAATNAKIALYSLANGATLDSTTTAYTTTGETTGTGYTAGGIALTVSQAPTSTGTTAFMNYADAAWAGASFSADGALIYNSTQANRAVAVLSFGGTVSSTAGNFTVQFPAVAYNTAIIQIGA